jgi:hypothetical protein
MGMADGNGDGDGRQQWRWQWLMAIAIATATAMATGTAVSLLLNLETAQQGRSMLFSDEQKLLFEGWKKGFVMNTKLDFMRG